MYGLTPPAALAAEKLAPQELADLGALAQERMPKGWVSITAAQLAALVRGYHQPPIGTEDRVYHFPQEIP